jgi:hypothetical protein
MGQGCGRMSDQFTPSKDTRFIEDDLNALAELDNKIAELITQRAERREVILIQMKKNNERLNASEDWFEGSVKGNPTPDRGEESVMAYDPGPTTRGRY